jgi:hypothetical protein
MYGHFSGAKDWYLFLGATAEKSRCPTGNQHSSQTIPQWAQLTPRTSICGARLAIGEGEVSLAPQNATRLLCRQHELCVADGIDIAQHRREWRQFRRRLEVLVECVVTLRRVIDRAVAALPDGYGLVVIVSADH